MKKWLFAIFALFIAMPASASLWNHYDGNLPSIDERAIIAQEAGIVSSQSEYTGTYDQNIALESYLVGSYPMSIEPILGGAFRPSNYKTTLAGSLTAVASEDQNIKVSSISIDGHALTDADVGDYIILTINPGSGNEERVACEEGTLTSGSSVYWENCTRGLNRYNSATSSARLKAHSPGETVIISNDDAFLSEQYSAVDDAETIAGLWTFTTYPQFSPSGTDPSNDADLTTKVYVDNLINQGAATSTETTAGIGQIATQIEQASSTFDANAPTFLSTKYASSTSANNYVVVSEADGYLNQGWIDLTEDFTLTGTTTLATTTITDLTVSGTAAFNGSAFGAGFTNMTVYTSSDTWTRPTGVTKIKVIVIGGGGDGGAGTADQNTGTGGGGSGGYGEEMIDVSATSSVAITVGAGSTGSGGGTSSFGGLCDASGGSDGEGDSNPNTGGVAGVGSSCDLNVAGGPGHASAALSLGADFAGGGGSSALGGGGLSLYTDARTDGNAGGAYGGGGGGCMEVGDASCTGGDGAAGVVIIYY